jgi:hypothetical protein
LRSSPLLIVGAYREGEAGENPAFVRTLAELNRRRVLVTLSLQPFEAEDSRTLTAHLLGWEIAPEVADLLHRQGEGNPFFLEELLRSLVEDGTLTWVEERWLLVNRPGKLLPPRVAEAIQLRLGRLDPVVMELLRLAAIIGRTWEPALVAHPFALVGSPPLADGVADGYAPRRRLLDQILVQAAVEAGAELREHFSVNELLMDDEKVIGVRGHATGGAMVSEKAHIVIGADGLRSFIARSVQAPTYNLTPALTCAYYTYWSGVPARGVELYPRPGQMIIAAPTNDGQTLIIIYWPNAAFHQVCSDIEANFLKVLELVPNLAERVRNGTRSERFNGTADLPNLYRRPFGPGWALAGDARYHKDPILALGISDAFWDAELLAGAVDAGLSDREPLFN